MNEVGGGAVGPQKIVNVLVIRMLPFCTNGDYKRCKNENEPGEFTADEKHLRPPASTHNNLWKLHLQLENFILRNTILPPQKIKKN
jgi:hypothetical protein|tara:strand:- start:777 stop:1034 length:258 start_codon:yes stop_codon:yes gene_type:complete